MAIINVCEFLATVLCLVGVIYGTLPRRVGLWYLIVGTVIWMIFAYYYKHWFFFSQESFLLVLNVISLKTWKKAGIKF